MKYSQPGRRLSHCLFGAGVTVNVNSDQLVEVHFLCRVTLPPMLKAAMTAAQSVNMLMPSMNLYKDEKYSKIIVLSQCLLALG